jgi:hypothetical protein
MRGWSGKIITAIVACYVHFKKLLKGANIAKERERKIIAAWVSLISVFQCCCCCWVRRKMRNVLPQCDCHKRACENKRRAN